MPCDFKNIFFNHTLPSHITQKNWKITNHLGRWRNQQIGGRQYEKYSFSLSLFYILFKIIPELHGSMNICGHNNNYIYFILIFLLFFSFFILVSMSTVPTVKATVNGSLKTNKKETSSFRIIETTQKLGAQSLSQNSICSRTFLVWWTHTKLSQKVLNYSWRIFSILNISTKLRMWLTFPPN